MGIMGQIRSKPIEKQVYRAGLFLLLLFLNACGGGGETPLGPQVVKTDPGNKAGDVPVNAPIRAVFSYDVDPVTVNRETFIVGGVDGTVAYQDQTAIFTPSPEAPFEEGKEYFVTLTTGIKDLDGISLPSNFSWSFVTSGLASVDQVDPKEGAVNVPVGTSISAVFSKPISAATLNGQTFFITDKAKNVRLNAAIAYDEESRTATMDPTGSLNFGAEYLVTVTTGVRDLAGNPLAAEKVWSFTVASEPDRSPPKVTSKAPAPNATGISTNTSISVTFDEKVDLEALRANFLLEGPNGPVSTTLAYDPSPASLTASLQPGANLEFGTTYRVVLRSGIKDPSGNRLPAEIFWSFTTGNAPDHTAPRIEGQVPADGAEGVPVKSAISVRFSEPMDGNSITAPNGFTVYRIQRGVREQVGGSVTVDRELLTATFTPASRLKYESTYSIFLSGQMKDLAGNFLEGIGLWTFTTTEAPQVIETSPGNADENVPTSTTIMARLSHPIRQASVGPDSFRIEGTAGGSYTFPDPQTVVLTPAEFLTPGTAYRATLTTGIEDIDGNPLDLPYSWFFTTSGSVENPPVVVEPTDPSHGAIGVPVGIGRISAAFDKAIDPASLEGRFTLVTPDGSEVFGSRSQSSGTQAILSFPSGSALLYHTWYRATLKSGIQSASHASSTAADYVWCFRTEFDPTMAPPPDSAPPAECAR